MNKLISNTDFGFYVRELNVNDHKKLELRENYDSFLKQPLTLGMFVPCDLNGNVLEEPMREYYDSMTGWNCPEDANSYENKYSLYQKSKSRVLFEGFEYKVTNYDLADLIHLGKKKNEWFLENKETKFRLHEEYFNSKDIEILSSYHFEFILTESAKQKIGL